MALKRYNILAAERMKEDVLLQGKFLESKQM
jgi:hypothetical protein